MDQTSPDVPNTLTAPIAKEVDTSKRRFSEVFHDPYAWLQNANDPGVKEHLDAENDYATSVLTGQVTLSDEIFREILSHQIEEQEGVPYLWRDYWYSFRMSQGKQYQVITRRHTSEDAEEVLLDLNDFGETNYLMLGTMAVDSTNYKYAYTLDTVGSHSFTLHIRDLHTANDLDTGISGVGSIAWSSRCLYYTIEDPTKRQCTLWRLDTSTMDQPATQVFEESDKRFSLSLKRSNNCDLIFLISASHDTTECYYLDARLATSQLHQIRPREAGVMYYPETRDGRIYLRINDISPAYRIISSGSTQESSTCWEEEVGPPVEGAIVGFEIFRTFWVVVENCEGLVHFRVRKRSTQNDSWIHFAEDSYSASGYCNVDFEATFFRYRYQSPVTPPSIYDYDIDKEEAILRKQQASVTKRDSYIVKRLQIEASDGIRIPVSIAYDHAKGPREKRPLYVYAYGAYGHALSTTFSAAHLSMIDRGVIVSFAHVRGGGERGRAWHDSGRAMNKSRGISDLLEVVRGLTQNGYGDESNVALEGGSAGGLLVTAAVNRMPSIARAIVLRSPFVDVINTMSDESLPLTSMEYQEWGDPRDYDDFTFMKTYSPYENIQRAHYPAMLVRTSLNDRNVMYWEAAKYVARVRALNLNKLPVLLSTSENGAHNGLSGRYKVWRESAETYAFILSNIDGAAGTMSEQVVTR